MRVSPITLQAGKVNSLPQEARAMDENSNVNGIVPAAVPARRYEPASGCGADVLRVLRDAGVRLTVPQVVEELGSRNLEHSQRSVERWLQILRENGLVDHDRDARPPGYGLTSCPPPGSLPEAPGAAPELTAIVRHVAGLIRPGEPLRFLLEVGGVRVRLEVGEAVPEIEAPARPPLPTSGCGADVVRVLQEAGGRLTLSQIMRELAERRIEWDERSVKRHLARLREDGHVDNDQGAQPPGYGLRRRLAQPQAGSQLSAMEADVLEAAAEVPLTGQQLGERSGYPWDGSLRACLAALRRRRLLGGRAGDAGYQTTAEGMAALAEHKGQAG
jgi:Fe2+ or Zn2+ uptake regulation protein